MAEKKETEMEQFNEEDFLTRSEEIEYNLKEIKKATQKLNEQKQEFAKKVKEYNEERKKMNELLKSLPKNEDDDDYDPEQMTLFDEDDNELFDTDFDDCIYDADFIKDLKVALFELNQVIYNTEANSKIRSAVNKVNKVVYEYENPDKDIDL